MRCVESRLSWGTRTTTTRGTVSPNTKALAIVGLDLCSEFGPFSGDSNSSYSSFHIASNVLRFINTRFVECAEKLFPYLCSSSRPRLLLHKTAVCFPFPPERYVSRWFLPPSPHFYPKLVLFAFVTCCQLSTVLLDQAISRRSAGEGDSDLVAVRMYRRWVISHSCEAEDIVR